MNIFKGVSRGGKTLQSKQSRAREQFSDSMVDSSNAPKEPQGTH